MYERVLILESRASEEEVLISRALEKALRRSEVVDRESLCIIAGQKVRSFGMSYLSCNSNRFVLLGLANTAGCTIRE